ncbi:MAG: hypothetical protein ABIA63_14270 [bacterium]
MGIPTSSSESFELLSPKAVISKTLFDKMVTFRNTAIHGYQRLEMI